ncbi:MAG: radical SAM protein, partial [Victivallaceae bacterium]
MIHQAWKLLRILFNPKITLLPLNVTRELRKRGIKRLPDKLYSKLEDGHTKLQMFKLVRKWLGGELLSRHKGQWVLNSFLPPFPGKSYNRMFENLLSGRRLSPVSAFMAVTAKCPFSCQHCSLQKRHQGSINPDYWLDAIKQLHQLGTSIFGFTGGEPLLREELPELIKAAADGGGTTIVFSSGHGFNQEMAEKLKKNGLWGFCVSLDSLDESETGNIRGKANALPTALEAIRIAVKNGFYTM